MGAEFTSLSPPPSVSFFCDIALGVQSMSRQACQIQNVLISIQETSFFKSSFFFNLFFRFHEQQTFLSKGNHLSVYFSRSLLAPQQAEGEYVDGAFSFLDGKEFVASYSSHCKIMQYSSQIMRFARTIFSESQASYFLYLGAYLKNLSN